MHCVAPGPVIQHRPSAFNPPATRPLASLPLDQINALHRARGDGSLASVENLFSHNSIVIIGEDHSTFQGKRYILQNREYLCNPLNDVVICMENYPLGASKEEMLQANTIPGISSAIRDGARVVGIDPDKSTKLEFTYSLLEAQLGNPNFEHERPAKIRELIVLTQEIQTMYVAALDALANMHPGRDIYAIIPKIDAIKAILTNGNPSTCDVRHCFQLLNGALLLIANSEANSTRCALNPAFVQTVKMEAEHHQRVLVIVGGYHAIDYDGYPGMKNLLNESTNNMAEAYFIENSEDEFSFQTASNSSPVLCLPGNLFPNSKDIISYGASFSYQAATPKQNNGCTLF